MEESRVESDMVQLMQWFPSFTWATKDDRKSMS